MAHVIARSYGSTRHCEKHPHPRKRLLASKENANSEAQVSNRDISDELGCRLGSGADHDCRPHPEISQWGSPSVGRMYGQQFSFCSTTPSLVSPLRSVIFTMISTNLILCCFNPTAALNLCRSSSPRRGL